MLLFGEPVPRADRLPQCGQGLIWVERRYKIEAMRFKARHETGFDWPGSDEVMVTTVDAKGWTVSDEFSSVDSGGTHGTCGGRAKNR